MRYAIPLVGINFRSPEDRRGEEKPWLFETLAHNLPREPGGGAIFLFLHAQLFENARSGKENEKK
jgi:hypothetical protein